MFLFTGNLRLISLLRIQRNNYFLSYVKKTFFKGTYFVCIFQIRSVKIIDHTKQYKLSYDAGYFNIGYIEYILMRYDQHNLLFPHSYKKVNVEGLTLFVLGGGGHI